MTTARDREILNALEGRASVDEREADQRILESVNGGPTAAERRSDANIVRELDGRSTADDYWDRKIVESLGGAPYERKATEGELPLKNGDWEATHVYAAEAAVERAMDELIKTLRSSGAKDPDSAALQIREQAYAYAARYSEYQGERLDAVASALLKEAQVARAKASEVSAGRIQTRIREALGISTIAASAEAERVVREAADTETVKALEGR